MASIKARRVWTGLLAGAAALAAAAVSAGTPTGDAARGADVFQDRCGGCHAPQGVSQGPSLIGVVGRKAASLPGFPYSGGLKASGLIWTAPNLDRFLQGPSKLAPGTAMTAVVPGAADRRDLIAYLATLRRR